MKNYFSKEKAFKILLTYWSAHEEIQVEHGVWLKANSKAMQVKKGQLLYRAGEKQQNIYFVCEGLLAKQQLEYRTGKRSLKTVARPLQALFTTNHSKSSTPTDVDIIALRNSTVIQIPYKNVQLARYEDKGIENLVDLLFNKKKRQIDKLLDIHRISDNAERYRNFRNNFPDLFRLLTQKEQSELLAISLRTIQRIKRSL
ncbi:Crp/Fnr family transcriptional regulator [Sphingobacterium sp. LRF_L2]|uniref:Crp/Fnr family transcriptional regulator n=1 Tax=Sphingobacterium sp. LRF_L2 TaxID=3369421 RepID=UPI003F5E082D